MALERRRLNITAPKPSGKSKLQRLKDKGYNEEHTSASNVD